MLQRRLEQDDDYIAAQAEAVVSPGGRLRSGLADSSGEQGGQGRAEEARKVQMPSALVQHRAVPVLVRAALPVCLLGNVALFLSGHLSLGAEVDLRVCTALALPRAALPPPIVRLWPCAHDVRC
jgi:hypothetical protein